MRYACLIYDDPALSLPEGSPEMDAAVRQYGEFMAKWSDRITGSDRLMPTATATTLRERGGELLTTDGPFAESKEHLGGFIIIEAEDLDEAIQIASEIPNVRLGSVEIRPVMMAD